MKIKITMKYDKYQRKYRLFRLVWTKGKGGDGKGYSGKLSFALRLRLFDYWTEWNGWQVTFLGVAIHKKLSYGGVIQ